MTSKHSQGTPGPQPKPSIAATISRYKGVIETSRTDITTAETSLGEAKTRLKAASATFSAALESSRAVSASLEGAGAGPQDDIGKRNAEARKRDALAIGLVEHVVSLAVKLNETIGQSIEDLLLRAGSHRQMIGTFDSFVGTAETTIPEPERESYLKNLESGLTLIERGVASLKRGVDEVCATVAEHCDENSIAMTMAREILAKVPPLPPKN